MFIRLCSLVAKRLDLQAEEGMAEKIDEDDHRKLCGVSSISRSALRFCLQSCLCTQVLTASKCSDFVCVEISEVHGPHLAAA